MEEVTALDHQAESELRRYVDRAKLLVALGVVVALPLIVLSSLDLSLFERVYLVLFASDTVILGTGLGSLLRARTERKILLGTVWRCHQCHSAPRILGSSANVFVQGLGTFSLGPTMSSRIRQSGILRSPHVEVAEGPDASAVLRVPGQSALFLAKRR